MLIEDKNLEANSKKIKFTFENKEYEAYAGETVASALTRNDIKNFRKDKNNGHRGIYCNMGICNECIVEIMAINQLNLVLQIFKRMTKYLFKNIMQSYLI